MKLTKVKGSSLLLAIVVSLIIAMTLLAFMLLYQYNRYFLYKGNKASELIHNVNSTLQLIETNGHLFDQEKRELDLYEEEKDSVLVSRKEWGLMDIWSLVAHTGKDSLQKAYLSGTSWNDSLALYLAGNNRPLSLCGKTLIKGNVKVSRQGVKRAYIEGQNFIGNRLVEGSIGRSKSQLPPLEEDLNERLKFWSNGGGAILHVLQTMNELNGVQGKHDSLLMVNVNGRISLGGGMKIAWTVIKSNTSIEVGSCRMQHCILIAPEIILKAPFIGSVQCFASKRIDVEKEVELQYPSNLVLSTSSPKSEIKLGEEASVDGGIIMIMQKQFPQKNWSRLTLDKGSLVRGSVYADGIVQMKGSIFGALKTRLFYLKTPSSVYENHLLNTTIDHSKVPDEFVGTFANTSLPQVKMIECLR